MNTLHDMFVGMKEDPSFNGAKFKVTLSYMEIYNELTRPTQSDVCHLKLNEDPVRGMVVQGITGGADSADEIPEPFTAVTCIGVHCCKPSVLSFARRPANHSRTIGGDSPCDRERPHRKTLHGRPCWL